MNFINNLKLNKIFMMQDSESSNSEIKTDRIFSEQRYKSNFERSMEILNKALTKYRRNSIIKDFNNTLKNIVKIEKNALVIFNSKNTNSFKIPFHKFLTKTTLMREALSIQTPRTIESIEKTNLQKRNTKLEIDFKSLKEELQILKNNLNKELEKRIENNNLGESQKNERWKKQPISELKNEIRKLNTQIKKINKLELSAEIYNKKIEFKNANKENKKPLMEKLKNLLKSTQSKLTNPKKIVKSVKDTITIKNIKSTRKQVINALKDTSKAALHPKKTLDSFKEKVKQKASGFTKDQFTTIEDMRKNNEAKAQINRFEEKLNKYLSNNYPDNDAWRAADLISEKMEKYNIKYNYKNQAYTYPQNNTETQNSKLIKDVFTDVKRELNNKINDKKHTGEAEINLTKNILKEVNNIEKSIEKAGKNIGSISR
jgi:hypothetical protein